jgi:hypothetical protein
MCLIREKRDRIETVISTLIMSDIICKYGSNDLIGISVDECQI